MILNFINTNMLRFFALSLVSVYVIGCKSIDETVDLSFSDKTIQLAMENEFIGGIDTVGPSSGIIVWGENDHFINRSIDTIPYIPGTIHSNFINGNYFSFRSGCGTACNFVFIGKMRSGDRGKLYMYPLLVDFSKELIAYQGGGEELVIVENLKSGKELEVNEPFDNIYRPVSLGIDSISFTKDSLYIAWQHNEGIVSKSFKTP